MNARPDVVSAEAWQHERDELLVAEKELTRAADALAARRRRLPMMKFDNTQYVFETPEGPMGLLGEAFRTYNTTQRGVDRLLFVNNILDLLPFGRQQDWEDSPPGWPQHPTYG